ncbi:MAG: hypothetical protein P8X79_07100 [Reinekea sp.]
MLPKNWGEPMGAPTIFWQRKRGVEPLFCAYCKTIGGIELLTKIQSHH